MQAEERIHNEPADRAGHANGQNGDGHMAPAPRGGGHDDEHAIPVDLPKVSGGAMALIGLVVLALFGGLFLLGWVPHSRRQAEARNEAREGAEVKPVVDVTTPKPSAATFDLLLPGDVRADQSTAVYARTSGYLKPLPEGIDIGARVKAGQVIAEIAAPEVDAELEQARASLEQANVVVGRATNEFNFNKGTYERYEGLAKTGGVTQQQLEEKRAQFNIATSSLKAAKASVLAAEAAVKRLTELQNYQRVVAPFDGVITARNYDAGAMISSTNTAAGRELFRIDHTDTLRVFVSVPQGYATEVRPGGAAELLVRNYPGRPFKGTVARTAGAIDPATRTMKVEVDVPNADGRLFPGMYGQVRFPIRQDRPLPVVPTSALVFGPEGMKVAVVDGDTKTVRFQKVVVGRDFGSEAEIANGLNGNEQVVTNPGERLTDGVEVRVNAPANAPGPQRRTAAGSEKPARQAAARQEQDAPLSSPLPRTRGRGFG